MFNFIYNQGAGNNRCGGYSLAAIATKLQPMGNHNPQIVYNFLRGRQMNLGPNSQILVNATNLGRTDILLPSTFRAAHYAQLNYRFYMNHVTISHHLSALGQTLRNRNRHINIDVYGIINEEIAAIGGNMNLHQIHGDLRQFLDNNAVNNHQYWLVLVGDATHWVAIEQNMNNNIIQYCIYNPAGGINAAANIAGDTITYYDNNNNIQNRDWSGIAISVEL